MQAGELVPQGEKISHLGGTRDTSREVVQSSGYDASLSNRDKKLRQTQKEDIFPAEELEEVTGAGGSEVLWKAGQTCHVSSLDY